MNKTIIDISWPLDSQTTSYKDAKPIAITVIKTVDRDGVQDSVITCNAHTGTHIDAPAHFLSQGATIEEISLAALVGPCRVLDLSHIPSCISRADIQGYKIQQGERILLKTRNSQRPYNAPFDFEFVYLAQDAADYLVQAKITLVGIDTLGIERGQAGHPTHKKLLSNNIVILEGLRLQDANEGMYTLISLPLFVRGIEAAPARAILIR